MRFQTNSVKTERDFIVRTRNFIRRRGVSVSGKYLSGNLGPFTITS